MDAIGLVKRYEQTVVDRDAAAMGEVLGSEAIYNGPGAAAANLKGKEITEFFQAFFDAFPDSTFDVQAITGSGDLVAVEWVYGGTMTGPLLGIAPTGASCSVRGTHIVRVEGGQIRSIQAYWDNLALYEQLGVKP